MSRNINLVAAGAVVGSIVTACFYALYNEYKANDGRYATALHSALAFGFIIS
jgi:hypothetical protein